MFFWGLRPQAPGILPLYCQSQLINFLAGLGCLAKPQPGLGPGVRRSGCVPAEPYPPLRPLVVYSEGGFSTMPERKNHLTGAALSDMRLIVACWRLFAGTVPCMFRLSEENR